MQTPSETVNGPTDVERVARVRCCPATRAPAQLAIHQLTLVLATAALTCQSPVQGTARTQIAVMYSTAVA
jgi:hypothetical protein